MYLARPEKLIMCEQHVVEADVSRDRTVRVTFQRNPWRGPGMNISSVFRKRDLRAGTRRIAAQGSDHIRDMLMDRRLANQLRKLRASNAYRSVPRFKVLIVGVQSPKREGSLDRIFTEMASDRHDVTTSSKGVENAGKLTNTNILLSRFNLDRFDYIITSDDDVSLTAHFLDDMLAIMHLADLQIAAPAHRLRSYHNHDVTRRVSGSIMRETNFVEVGPVAVFSKPVFSHIFPLPELAFGWGLDLLWSKLAEKHGWRMGVVDAAPLRHLARAGSNYDWEGAYAEMKRFKSEHEVTMNFADFRTLQTFDSLS